jgi:pyruvate formate lyase activating enzyme
MKPIVLENHSGITQVSTITTWDWAKKPKPDNYGKKATRYWRKLDDGRVQCEVCPRFCKLRNGQQGLCFVRACENDQIVLNTYGRSSGFCIDPVEKKPLNHFMPGTPVLSFGTAGCNLACKFCQNWDMSKSREMDKLADEASPEKLAEVAEQTGCKSIAFTYNDPVIFLEYAVDAALAAREKHIKSIAVTAGYVCPEPRAKFFEHMDAANVDLKAFSERFYHKICGGHLEPVLETLKYLKHETSVWLEITTLLIPGENDSSEELEAMTQWIAENLGPDVPLHFSAFHPDYKMLDHPNTPVETLSKARDIAISAGLHYVYTGNVHDSVGGSTYCPNCATRLIERDWYQLGEWKLDSQSCCNKCGTWIAGVFEENPGTWGRQRQVVRINGARGSSDD